MSSYHGDRSKFFHTPVYREGGVFLGRSNRTPMPPPASSKMSAPPPVHSSSTHHSYYVQPSASHVSVPSASPTTSRHHRSHRHRRQNYSSVGTANVVSRSSESALVSGGHGGHKSISATPSLPPGAMPGSAANFYWTAQVRLYNKL